MDAGLQTMIDAFKADRGVTTPEEVARLSPVERDIAEGCLAIHYQPLVDLRTRKLFAFEGLARTTSQRYPSPLELFEAALEYKCVGELGRCLRHIAVTNGPSVPLFINANPNEFDEGWLVRPDEPIFWHSEAIYLEITESVPLSHFALCHSVIKEVRSKSIFLAVDDLGAGYSNLKYISDLAPEVVKLDRELIAGIVHNSRQYKLLVALVRLCTEMGAKVVGEGIETKEELQAVIDAGVHYGQGFLLARPAFPAPEFTWPL